MRVQVYREKESGPINRGAGFPGTRIPPFLFSPSSSSQHYVRYICVNIARGDPKSEYRYVCINSGPRIMLIRTDFSQL